MAESPFTQDSARQTWEGMLDEIASGAPLDSNAPLPSSSEVPMTKSRAIVLEFSSMVQNQPDQILQAIQQNGLTKLGDISVKDGLALAAFGSKVMLTRGREMRVDRNWDSFWRSELKKLAKGKKPKMGWSRKVLLSAYVLKVQGATTVGSKGLLHKILLNIKAGSCEEEVLKLPALRATIDYKWEAWAGKLLMIELILYVGWLLSYSLFMYFFLIQDMEEVDPESLPTWHSTPATVFAVFSFLMMWPFIVVEIFTIVAYKMRWFSIWNLIDVGCYALQFVIFFTYISNARDLDFDWFSTCLAVESILLFVRIQYYARAFGSVNISFVDTLMVLLKEVRWFFFFIFLTISSFALAFAALYRNTKGAREHLANAQTEMHLYEDYKSVGRALITTFSFMLGGFQTEYFFESHGWTPVATSILFVIFEILIGITLLNLLVAIMIDAYAKIKKNESLIRDLNRAHVIDELEMTLPSVLTRPPHEYIHMLVIKQDRGEMFPPSLVPQGGTSGGQSSAHTQG